MQLHGEGQSRLLWHLTPKHCGLPEQTPLGIKTQLHGKRQSAVLRQLTPKHSLLPEQVPKASGTARTGAESLSEFGDAGLSSSLSAFWSASARLSGRLIHRSAVKNNRALYMPGRDVVNWDVRISQRVSR